MTRFGVNAFTSDWGFFVLLPLLVVLVIASAIGIAVGVFLSRFDWMPAPSRRVLWLTTFLALPAACAAPMEVQRARLALAARDLPVPEGAEQVERRTRVLGSTESPGPSIIVTFRTRDSAQHVKSFYHAALAQRGWAFDAEIPVRAVSMPGGERVPGESFEWVWFTRGVENLQVKIPDLAVQGGHTIQVKYRPREP